MPTIDDQPDEELADEAWLPGPLLSWPKLVTLVAAFAFLAGAVVYYFDNRPASASSVDGGFYRDMVFHHEQAVQMSLIELGNGTDPTVRDFAQEIVIFQQYEIGRMDEQLRQWGLTRHDETDTAMSWMGHPTPLRTMPGLATDDQLDALRAAKGANADALFLDLMAEHHRAGAQMAEYAVQHADDGGVRALAQRMARNQSIEIGEFAQTAARLGYAIDIAPYESDSSEHSAHGG